MFQFGECIVHKLVDFSLQGEEKTNATPTTIIAQPALVVNTSRANAAIETGGSGPRVTSYITLAASSQSRKIPNSPADCTRAKTDGMRPLIALSDIPPAPTNARYWG